MWLGLDCFDNPVQVSLRPPVIEGKWFTDYRDKSDDLPAVHRANKVAALLLRSFRDNSEL